MRYSNKYHTRAQVSLIAGLIISFFAAVSIASLVFPNLQFIVFFMAFIAFGLITYSRYKYYHNIAKDFENLENQIEDNNKQLKLYENILENLNQSNNFREDMEVDSKPEADTTIKEPENAAYEFTTDGKIKCKNCGTVQRANRTKCFECGAIFKNIE